MCKSEKGLLWGLIPSICRFLFSVLEKACIQYSHITVPMECKYTVVHVFFISVCIYMLGVKHGFVKSTDCAMQSMDPSFGR